MLHPLVCTSTCMCVCICECLSVHLCVFVHLCASLLCKHISVCTSVCISFCPYLSLYLCTKACVCFHVSVHLFRCVCVCLCVSLFFSTHLCVHACMLHGLPLTLQQCRLCLCHPELNASSSLNVALALTLSAQCITLICHVQYFLLWLKRFNRTRGMLPGSEVYSCKHKSCSKSLPEKQGA